MNTVPQWRLAGDWFDICSCNIPCPCEFAQAPTNNACLGMLVWHIREGNFGAPRQSRLAIHNRQRPRQAEETVPSVRVTRATRMRSQYLSHCKYLDGSGPKEPR